MRYVLALIVALFAMPTGITFANEAPRRDLLGGEFVLSHGAGMKPCFDVPDGYLRLHVATTREPERGSIHSMLYLAADDGGRVGAPLLETAVTSSGTSSAHRVEQGTYCLWIASVPDRGVSASGAVHVLLSHEPS